MCLAGFMGSRAIISQPEVVSIRRKRAGDSHRPTLPYAFDVSVRTECIDDCLGCLLNDLGNYVIAVRLCLALELLAQHIGCPDLADANVQRDLVLGLDVRGHRGCSDNGLGRDLAGDVCSRITETADADATDGHAERLAEHSAKSTAAAFLMRYTGVN